VRGQIWRKLYALDTRTVFEALGGAGIEEGEEVSIVIVKRDLSRCRGILGNTSYKELKNLKKHSTNYSYFTEFVGDSSAAS